MANDHYISRFLTRPWEPQKGLLWCLDLDAKTLQRESSATLFAKQGLHSVAVGDAFGRLIELPVADHRRRWMRKRTGAMELPGTREEWRAYVILFVTLGARIPTEQRQTDDLEWIVTKGSSYLDQLTSAVLAEYEFVGIQVPRHVPLFFNERGYFPIPVVGAPPALCLPITPFHAVAMVSRRTHGPQVERWLQSPHVISALSIGVSEHARRIVVPPTVANVTHDAAQLAASLQTLRSHTTRLIECVNQAAEITGLAGG